MEHKHKSHEYEAATPVVVEEGSVETKDRGLFDFMGKKEEEKPQEEVIVTEFEEKVQVSESELKIEEKEEEKKHGLLEKLHRSDSSSSSSSDEEEGEGEEKKKKKKEKKKKEKEEDTAVPIEKCDDVEKTEEEKGFIEKIKDKLPGQKKTEEVHCHTSPAPEHGCSAEAPPCHEGEPKEKKSILEKIKEKLPGYHPKTEEEKEKEKEKECH